jgi:hypothetical protein
VGALQPSYSLETPLEHEVEEGKKKVGRRRKRKKMNVEEEEDGSPSVPKVTSATD